MTTGTRIRVSMFGGVASVPVQIARSHGLFTQTGLDVDLTQTKGSRQLMSGLAAGDFEIVHAAPDNFVEWRDRTGLPVVAWIGGAPGWLGLFSSSPNIRAVAELRGKSIAVDAVNSGFVSVLRTHLHAAGMTDTDVELEPVGATNARFQMLLAGRTDATMLTLPWAAKARDAGLPELAGQNSDGPRLPGSCAGSLSAWLDDNATVADAYLRAVCAATTWLRMPTNRHAAQDEICDLLKLEPQYADVVLDSIIDPVAGSPAAGNIDLALMQNLLELRRANQQPPNSDAEAYVDFGPYERVFSFGLSHIPDREPRKPGDVNG